MRTESVLAVAVALAALQPARTRAQFSGVTNQEVFPLQLRVSCRSPNPDGTRIVNTEVTGADLVANALGTNVSRRPAVGTHRAASLRPFAVVFNPTLDSIQVINVTNGALLAEVADFSGLAATAAGRANTEFASMFLPGKNQAVGSAVINEYRPGAAQATTNHNAIFIGNLQFALTGDEVLGGVNPAVTTGPGLGPDATTATPGTTGFGNTFPNAGFGAPPGSLTDTNFVNHTNPVVSTNLNGMRNSALTQTNVRVCLGLFIASGPPLVLAPSSVGPTAPTLPTLPGMITNPPAVLPGAPALPAPTRPGALALPTPALPPSAPARPALPLPGGGTNAPPGINGG
jgi:hypothetical protein